MKKRWTKDELELVRSMYPDYSTADIAKRLGRNSRSVYQQSFNMGLKKSAQFMSEVHGAHITKARGPGRLNKGLPHKPLGSTSVDSDGFLRQKVGTTGVKHRDWRPIHLLLWEKHHGPVPEGHIVYFKDGDKRHISIENLACISRAEAMKIRSFQNLPEPLKEVIRLKTKVNRLINERTGK